MSNSIRITPFMTVDNLDHAVHQHFLDLVR
jgi:hypothetical protein